MYNMFIIVDNLIECDILFIYKEKIISLIKCLSILIYCMFYVNYRFLRSWIYVITENGCIIELKVDN